MTAGGECVGVVAHELKKRGIPKRSLAFYAGESGFRGAKAEPDRILGAVSPEICKEQINEFKPTHILTGTQIQDEKQLELGNKLTFEQILWKIAKEGDLPTLAILDAWASYAPRFSDLDVKSGTNKLTMLEGGHLAHLPDKIAIPDEYAKREMLALGFPKEKLAVTGNPYHEHFLNGFAKLPDSARATLLEKPVFADFYKDGKIVVFFSDSHGFYPDIGFDEKSVLVSFVKELDRAAGGSSTRINLIVRPHPFRNEDAKDAFESAAKFASNIKMALHHPAAAHGSEPKNEYPLELLLKAADVVAGTFNEPLTHACIVGKTTIHYQPSINPKYKFHANLYEQGFSTLVNEEQKLGSTIFDALNGILVQKPLGLVKGATDRVIQLLFSQK